MSNGETPTPETVLEERYAVIKRISSALQENNALTIEVEKKKHFQQILVELQTELRTLAKRLHKEDELSVGEGMLHHVYMLPTYTKLDRSLFKTLKNALLEKSRQHQRPPVVLEGPAGVGKSLLAATLAHDEEVRQAYPDGIFWINFGTDPDIVELQNRLIHDLGGRDARFVDPEAATAHIQQICEERICLFILDDVWEIQDVLAFQPNGKNNQTLIISAHPDLIEFVKYSLPNTQGYKYEGLNEAEAQELFLNCANQSKLDDINALVTVGELNKLCAYNPQAIRLVAGAARNQTPVAWEDLKETFAAAEVEDFPAEYPQELYRALQTALDSLGEDADYYLSLAVLKNHSAIPQATVMMFWQYLYKIQEKQAYNLLMDFAGRGLLSLSGEAQIGNVHLQEFQYAYLQADPDLDKLHSHLLMAYTRQCQSGWLSGPDDGYFYQNLCHHLHAAKRVTELKSLLLDFEWLQKKLELAGPHSLMGDYEYLGDDDVAKVKKALFPGEQAMALHSAEHLADVLFDGLWEARKASKDINAMLNQAREILPDWEPPYPEQDAAMLE